LYVSQSRPVAGRSLTQKLRKRAIYGWKLIRPLPAALTLGPTAVTVSGSGTLPCTISCPVLRSWGRSGTIPSAIAMTSARVTTCSPSFFAVTTGVAPLALASSATGQYDRRLVPKLCRDAVSSMPGRVSRNAGPACTCIKTDQYRETQTRNNHHLASNTHVCSFPILPSSGGLSVT